MLTQKKVDEMYRKKDEKKKRARSNFNKGIRNNMKRDGLEHHYCDKDIIDYCEVKKLPRIRIK